MSLYYVVRVYTNDQRNGHSCLVHVGGQNPPWGTCHETGPAHRFLWKDEAEEALRTFLVSKSQPLYTRGRVYHVVEDPVGPFVSKDEADKSDKVVIAPDQTGPIGWVEEGEALLNHPSGPMLQFQSWLVDNAIELMKWAKIGKRLDWLRQNPEGCRALHDCKNVRAPGYVFCAGCMEKGVGGYFDVYATYYTEKFNKVLEDIVRRLTPVQVAGKKSDDVVGLR
jgi:hypothetical protein